MKKLSLCLIALFFSGCLSVDLMAQSVDADFTINIYCSNEFDEADQKLFIKSILASTKVAKKQYLKVSLISFYGSGAYEKKTAIFLSGQEIKNITAANKNITAVKEDYWNQNVVKALNANLNTKFKQPDQLFKEIQSKSIDSRMDIFVNSDNSVLNFNKAIPNKLEQIKGAIAGEWKRRKASSEEMEINLFYDKGLREFVFSKERMLRSYEAFQNGSLYKMKPDFLNVEEYVQLRPQGSVGNDNPYVIRFDSVGYFDSYELVIYRSGTEDILFKERLEFSEETDDHYSLSYTGDGRVCEIRIMAKHLGMLCYSTFPDQNLNSAPDVTDCGPCSLECLYKKNWDLQIRGCVEGASKDKLWTERVRKVEFQCPNKTY
jgi:hypothetical protein